MRTDLLRSAKGRYYVIVFFVFMNHRTRDNIESQVLTLSFSATDKSRRLWCDMGSNDLTVIISQRIIERINQNLSMESRKTVHANCKKSNKDSMVAT